MQFGVQTFTVRKAQKKSIRQAYLPLIKLGIKSFEVARIDFSPKNAKALKALTEEYGIEITSVQVKPKYVFASPEKIIDFCHQTGCKNVVISMLPFKCILGKEETFYRFLSTLDPMFDVYAKQGITLAYHHHNWEYIKLSCGKTRMQELISKTQKIKFVHDTYWTARSGVDPAAQIEAFGRRLLGIHLRDLAFKKRGIGVLASDAAVGDGMLDFASALKAAEAVGCSYYVIEQKTDIPYREIEKSFHALKAIKSSLENKE
ncbi:MAG: sugar phosphate isomerase/epimerase [Clostridia bacterium]|nr:sugar phosphate isomerase/epimerase [Clostridia bacterium]